MALICICLAWIIGIFIGSRLDLPVLFLLVGLVPLPLLLLTRRRKPVILACLVIVVLISGALYAYSSLNNISEKRLYFYNDRGTVEITGVVSTAPEVRDKSTRLLISIDAILQEGERRDIDGKALVFVPRYPAYKYGDAVRLSGELETPQQVGDFDYRNYLAHQGIYTVMYYPSVEVTGKGQGLAPMAWIYSFRESLAQNIAEALPEPQAALAQGIILGIRGNIPDDLRDNFAASGTSHLLAISGLHLGIMTGVMLGIGLFLFGRRHYLYVWLVLVMIWLYVIITGMHAPVVRGAIMASLFLIAELLGRQKSGIVALTFAAAVMVGVSPYILGDASFQLSFLAMAGLVFLFPVFREFGRGITLKLLGEDGRLMPAANLIVDMTAATLAAIIAVWPVVAYYFGIVSLAGPIATLLALPVLPFIIMLGAFTGLLGFISTGVAGVFGWTAWLFLSYLLAVVNGLSSPAISTVEMSSLHPAFLWGYYIVIGGAVWAYNNRRRLFKGRRDSDETTVNQVPLAVPRTFKWLFVPLIAAAVLAVLTVSMMPDDRLRVSLLDVGEGDAILVQKGSRQVLIDGGPSPQAIGLELGEQVPFWDRKIELIVLTHPHRDHLAGLVEVTRRYDVEKILCTDIDYESPLYDEWQGIIEEKSIDMVYAEAGQVIDMGDGVHIEVHNPVTGKTSDLDNNSIVLRLEYNDISFLLTGDIMLETEWRLIWQGNSLESTVLKAAHHGSDTSTTKEFLAAVSPEAVAICCGEGNRFGHPDDVVMNRLESQVGEENIYRTDRNGTIEFITDGERLWVEVEEEAD